MTGSFCHRFGPGRLPYTERRDVGGGVAGGLTAVLSLAPIAVAIGGLIAVTSVTAATPMELAGAVVDFAMAGALAYGTSALLTGWLAVPLGLFGGWYHERTRRDGDADAGPAAA